MKYSIRGLSLMKIGFSNFLRPITNLLLNVSNDSADCWNCFTIDKFFRGLAGTGQHPANLKPILRAVGNTVRMRALLYGNISAIAIGSLELVAATRGVIFNRILVDIFSGVFRDFSTANVFSSNFFMKSERNIISDSKDSLRFGTICLSLE